jgi:hypothetical protein
MLMDEDLTSGIPQLPAEENAVLTTPFSEMEVWEAISQMEHNKVLGQDGFPGEFYPKSKRWVPR